MGIRDGLKRKAKGRITSFKELYSKYRKRDTPESDGGEGAGQKEKKSIFGGFGGLWKTIKDIRKRKCKACGSIDLKFIKEDEKMTSYQCNDCNVYSNFYKKKKKKKPEKKPEEEPGKEGEEGKKKESKPRRGSLTTVALSILAIMGGLFMEIPTALIILCAVFLALGILSFLLPDRLKPLFRVILIIAFFASVAFLYFTGGFQDILAVIPPAYTEQIEETLENIMEEAIKTYETSKCYTKVNPDLVNACLKELEEQKEEEVKKIGKNENLKIEYKQKVGDKTFDNKNPDVSKRYNFYFFLKSDNDRCPKGSKECTEYPIEVKDINVAAVGNEGVPPVTGDVKRHTPYTIHPQEDMPVRVEWNKNLPECTNNIDFLINITSVQISGGGSAKYGLAPQEEGNIDFLHYFDPEIETNPGPLDIYVFTDPYAVNLDPDWYTEFAAIIKIKNKAEGTAFLDNITLIQTFEGPWSYFEITQCYDDEDNSYTLNSYTEGECSGGGDRVNCFTLKFNQFYYDRLNLTKDESKEIICIATIKNRDNLTSALDDLISVFTPSYEFLQEFKETMTAECELTG